MRSDYPLAGKTVPLKCYLEKEVAEHLFQMKAHTELSLSELVNTALKRFIVTHKDFLPGNERKVHKVI